MMQGATIQCSQKCEIELQILPSLSAAEGAQIGLAIAAIWALAWGIRLMFRLIDS